jgi:crotonobetainyl-CoA:carnitine CoA-transferase CaiB-like acyl-CoA transferase
MFKPLNGIKVIDLTSVLAGPYCTYQLSLLGAEVIKIENMLNGDWTRSGGIDNDLNSQSMGSTYLVQNSNKKSIQVDLKTKKGQNILYELIKSADVFVENMRPGKAEKLGLDWDHLSGLNERLIYCSISAFGQDGPFSRRGAYDHVVQGMSGIMTTTGTKNTGPTKVGAPYIDYSTGLNAAFAITSALLEVKKNKKAIRLDVSMLDTSFLLMANMVTEHLNSGWVPEPMGNEAQSGSPSSGLFNTKTSQILLAANNDHQFSSLCDALNTISFFDKEKWIISDYRKKNKNELRTELQKIFKMKTAEFLEILLNEYGVPAGKIRSLPEALQEDQFKLRGLWNPIYIKNIGKDYKVPSVGFKVNQNPVKADKAPPVLGENTKSILKSLNFTNQEIKSLFKEHIVK